MPVILHVTFLRQMYVNCIKRKRAAAASHVVACLAQHLGQVTETGQALSGVLGGRGRSLSFNAWFLPMLWFSWSGQHVHGGASQTSLPTSIGFLCKAAGARVLCSPFSLGKVLLLYKHMQSTAVIKECFRLLKESLTKVRAKSGLMLKWKRETVCGQVPLYCLLDKSTQRKTGLKPKINNLKLKSAKNYLPEGWG